MTLCPIALAVGCKKCPAFTVCPLKSVIGDYGNYPWIDPEGLQYFRSRLSQAPRDAAYALALVTERATSRELQARAVAALEFKCDVLWSLLDAVQAGALPWMPTLPCSGPGLPDPQGRSRL